MSNPNPVTGEELARNYGRPASDFTEALAAIDQEALFSAERAKLVAGVWDQASSINGVDAAAVLEALTIPAGGAVVTIGGTDGSVNILQPFDPTQPGARPIPVQDAQAVADRMADGMASERARAQTIAQLPPELLTGGSGPAGPGEDPGVDLQPLLDQLASLQTQTAAQQESIDWLAGVVIDLATGEAPTE